MQPDFVRRLCGRPDPAKNCVAHPDAVVPELTGDWLKMTRLNKFTISVEALLLLLIEIQSVKFALFTCFKTYGLVIQNYKF